MNAEMLETLGKIAGIGGICVGVALIVFHKVISESILGTMGREHAYRLVLLVTVCVWTIALAGIGAWVLTEAPGNNGESADKPSIKTQGAQSPVVKDTKGSVNVSIGEPKSGAAPPKTSDNQTLEAQPTTETRGDQSPVVQGTSGDVRINIGTGAKE
jgi:hypothetical protein